MLDKVNFCFENKYLIPLVNIQIDVLPFQVIPQLFDDSLFSYCHEQSAFLIDSTV